MLDWMKWRRPTEKIQLNLKPAEGRHSAMTGRYVPLYTYLENRHADSVVLTFAQIEDLVGFPLPDQARSQREWWTGVDGAQAGSSYADAWRLASRTASPNLMARIVQFDRAS